ncbi:Crp/Fnr family transcriptional regulator [Hyphomicrobium sulfonivorans]|uniref:Crp/Fnr family transcriptional regulator n=1 Tax=Hyphomicrobium sulfonivorans TaxID=121290 RepID=UPI001570BB82|nr:Crp/Fnr family transcriptional regulator [Hyphomicrobium sulfonivorans]MBI1649243.1 Crp/Fnr family transcriptional regulator [Hyphomicrobium sulfonivorans]NSL70227.1 hypothetical protein [Hyphomicrobium sulfonivorans]
MLAYSVPQIDPIARSAFSADQQKARVRRLARGETLFHAGDARSMLYRVERGALCHYIRWADGRHDVIEFAFPGDIIGFGHMDTHISTAQAAARTIVSQIDPAELEQLMADDAQLAVRYASAVDREFDFIRMRAVQSTQDAPARRVASFLAALSYMGVREGRDANLIPDEVSSGAVADQLGMNIASLARVLSDLKTRGMITETPQGLRILDLDALEQFADAR